MLQALLLEEMFLSLLKIHAGRAGMRFKEYRRITVTLSNGHRVEINSPYTSTSSAQASSKPNHTAGGGNEDRTEPVPIRGWRY